MRRTVIFQIVFILICLGCQPRPPGDERSTQTPTREAPATSTVLASSSPSPTLEAPAVTPTLPSVVIPHFANGQAVTITEIQMVDSLTGWALGVDDDARADHVLRTTDGGNTWQDITPPELSPLQGERFRRAGAFFLDSTNAWVLYEPREGVPVGAEAVVVWATQMDYRHWGSSMPLDVAGSPYFEIEFIRFTNTDIGWIVVGLDASMGHAWIALNRMSHSWPRWELVIGPQSEEAADLHYCCKTDLAFVDAWTGLMTFGRGPSGDLFVDWTYDGGLTWQQNLLPSPDEGQAPPGFGGVSCMSHSPTIFSPQSALVGVECYSDPETPDETVSFLYVTQDAGGEWDIRPYPGGSLQFLSPEVGFALGRSIFITRNGGATWSHVSDVVWDGQFNFIDNLNGWAVAINGDQIELMQTTDGAQTWTALEPHIQNP